MVQTFYIIPFLIVYYVFVFLVINADIKNGPMRHQRKLLEVKSDDDDIQSFHGLSELLTVATVLTMVVVLAMCTCGRKNVKE